MNNANKFLQAHELLYTQTDIEQLIDANNKELINALYSRPSSLSFIPSRCYIKNISRIDGKIVAVDCGGTNLRVALVGFDEKNEPIIEKQDKYILPFTSKDANSQEFFSFITDKIIKIHKKPEYIGVSCAYKSTIDENRDAKIQALGKEMRVRGIENKHFAFEMKKYLHDETHIICLNDTPASMLGNLDTNILLSQDFCCGLVVGTGMNTCFKQPEKGILAPSSDKSDIIVTESGCFDKTKRSQIDIMLDKNSNIPTDHQYEKMIGGRYLPNLFAYCMEAALKEGYIKDNSYAVFDKNGSYLDRVLRAEIKGKDDEFAREVLRHLIKRASAFCAANIASYSLLSGCKKVFISCEGTTLNKLGGFKNGLIEYLNEILLKKEQIKYELISCEDSVIKGAAKAVLM